MIRNGGLRSTVRLVAPILVLGAAGYVLLAVTHSTGFLESRSHLQGYDQQRFATQSEALHDATRHLFGFGPGQVEVNLPLASHSLYARVAYEQGVPGLITLGALFVLTLAAAVRLVGRRSDFAVSGPALLGIWVGLTANSFFIDTLHWRHLWIFAGLIWTSFARSPGREGEDEKAPQVGTPRRAAAQGGSVPGLGAARRTFSPGR
jgi:O-antigen ligase